MMLDDHKPLDPKKVIQQREQDATFTPEMLKELQKEEPEPSDDETGL